MLFILSENSHGYLRDIAKLKNEIIMATKQNQGMVQIPSTTLNALKGLLFTKTGNGVDLTGIIEDLGGDDLVAINVALVYNKIVPEIDTTIRWEHHYRNQIYRYEFVHYSLLLDRVTCKRTMVKVLEDGALEDSWSDEVTTSYDSWLCRSTDLDSVVEKAKA
jgi:hypothetical protein